MNLRTWDASAKVCMLTGLNIQKQIKKLKRTKQFTKKIEKRKRNKIKMRFVCCAFVELASRKKRMQRYINMVKKNTYIFNSISIVRKTKTSKQKQDFLTFYIKPELRRALVRKT